MQLVLTLALLAATSSAIQMSKSVDLCITYEHNNCGKFDDWEDCREDAYLGATEDEYKKCIEDLYDQGWEECGGHEKRDFECFKPIYSRHRDIRYDYNCLQDNSC